MQYRNLTIYPNIRKQKKRFKKLKEKQKSYEFNINFAVNILQE